MDKEPQNSEELEVPEQPVQSEIPQAAEPVEQQPQFQPQGAMNQQMPQGQMQTPPKSAGMSIAGMVLGIVGLVCCGLPGILGFIFGLIGLKKDKAAGAPTGMAIAGIVTGGISVLVWAIYVGVVGLGGILSLIGQS